MHRVVCLLLAKARIRDNDLRAFISHYIDTADVPDWLQAHESDHRVTMNFALPLASSYVPFLLTQLFDCCDRSSATRFEEPLIDGTGAAVGFLSLEPWQWQQTLDVGSSLASAVLADNEELGTTDDEPW